MSISFFIRLTATVVISLALASAVLGCAEAKSTVEVSVHGVNYSGTSFSYYLVDPATQRNDGVGELIGPFAAGGTVCCFSLPKIWRPGIKVQIRATHWLPKIPDGSLPEVKKVHTVDVPRYVDNTPGELWVMRGADGSMSVISSDFQPDHPKWPGSVKGWPIPSLEYRRERWALIKEHDEAVVDAHVALLDELEKIPEQHARGAWEFAKTYDRKDLEKFSGPDDVRYHAYLKQQYMEGLERGKAMLQRRMENKP